MSLSYAAHINGDKVYDIATGYWIEAKQEAAASTGRMQWSVYLYDDTGTFVEKYVGSSFPEADAAKYEFAGFDVAISSSTATWRVCELYTPSYSLLSGTGTSATLKQYFSGEQGYAINADYAVIDVQPLAVSDNGTYTAPFSKAYSPVTVDVPEYTGYTVKGIPSTPTAVASFSDGTDLPMPALKVGIEPVQSGSGDPSPTNIRPINGWTGCNITVADDTTDPTEENVYNISFPAEAGTVYGGTVDVVNGLLTADKIGVTVSNLPVYQNFKVGTYTCIKRFILPYNPNLVIYNQKHGAISSFGLESASYYGTDRTSDQGSANVAFAITAESSILAIYDPDLTLTDTTFMEKYGSQQVVYPLATPITYQLSPTAVQTLLGQNIIYADTGDIVEGEYLSIGTQDVPWQPLEDGYSNFWFELTNDTLSPWLNFSAKNDDAVIDWGDGSGEVALDTLTPTHTYAKAGKYVVKVKGVTGIARQQNPPYVGAYLSVLKYVELNSEIVSCETNTFVFCTKLQNITFGGLSDIPQGFLLNATNVTSISIPNGITVIPQNFARNGYSLASITIPNNLTSIKSDAFYYCISLTSVIIPSTVNEIGSTAFASCNSLDIVHIQATTPPTLGSSTFSNLPSDYIIYVPAGYGETYKAAAGWSAYADHILEEGQTPNRAMLSKFAKEAKAAAKAAAEVEDK